MTPTALPPLLAVTDLSKSYPVRKMFRTIGAVNALSGVSFSIERKETLAVVGESGCGKSTLAKVLMQIERPTGGTVAIEGKTPEAMEPRAFRKTLQMIFQDPYSSINPRKRAWEIIAEPLIVNTAMTKNEARAKAEAMMAKVGLRPEYSIRYPHMFSGGQRQRIGIARALTLEPKIIICDEPVSALDVSIQAQILNVLLDLQRELELSYLFISHDLSVVEHVADRVLVIYLGRAVEYGPRNEVFANPKHPYTQVLLSSAPKILGKKPGVKPVIGELPSRLHIPSGCAFHKRCPFAKDLCSQAVPELRSVAGREVACHFAGQI